MHPNDKYKPEYAEQAKKLAYLGATDRILAAVFNVDEDTVRRWATRHPEFRSGLLSRKTDLDGKIARSLFERAQGYTYTTQEAVKFKLPGGGEDVKVVDVVKHVEPHTTAMIFWLKNRHPALWRDVQQVEHSGLDSLLGEIMNTSRGLPSQHPSAKEHRKPTQH